MGSVKRGRSVGAGAPSRRVAEAGAVAGGAEGAAVQSALAPARAEVSPLFIRDLSVGFPTAGGLLEAVRGVDLAVERGECLGIVGESGSGKSVTAAAAMGLLPRDAVVEGEILLNGRSLSSIDEDEVRDARGRVISMIFQEPGRSFDPIYSVGRTFEETFPAKDRSISREAARDRTVRLLREVHLPQPEERLVSFPHQLSGGLLQRIMIALALANDPEVLIADEPTTALDVTIQAQIVGLLAELQERRSLSLIFISHDLGLVGQIADRILVMYGGLVLESGDAAEILTRPRSPYTRSLFRALPAWGSHYSRSSLATIKGTIPDPTHPEPGCPFAPRCYLAVEECSRAIPPIVSDPADPTPLSSTAKGGGGAQPSRAAAAAPAVPAAGGGVDERRRRVDGKAPSASLYRCIFSGVKE